jgi:polyribonucleotide 5'-hydroxyl-kinase
VSCRADRRKSVAVYSWSGCELEVEGECHAYVAEETPMVSYLNVHVVLEARRTTAKQDRSAYGPKVLIAGGCDVGKSTLARILLSYGARVGSGVTYADIDVGQNSVTVPGALAAVHVSKPFDVETGLGASKAPLAYFFGHTSPSANHSLYRKQVDALAAELSRHLASKPEARANGILVNTCGWTDGDGYDLLLHAIRAFKIDVVLVIDHERLFNDIKNAPFPQKVECIKLRKSGGVLARDPETRRADRQRAVREYFYGSNNELHPHSTVMNFGVMKVRGELLRVVLLFKLLLIVVSRWRRASGSRHGAADWGRASAGRNGRVSN